MPKKVLFIANTDRHIKLCHIPYLKMFKDEGYIVHVATNSSDSIEYCDKKIGLKLKRNPFHFDNIISFFEIRKLVKKEQYDVITCHTPMGGFLGRCAVIGTKLKTKVFYTAHGFHFYKGARKINWLVYYTVEKILAKYTDALLTMNNEDYELAKKKFNCDVYKINGIGMNSKRLELDNEDIRKELNLNGKFVVTYIAEISRRKNQKKLLKELKKYDLEKENIVILLVGDIRDKRNKDFAKYVSKYKNVIYVSFKNNVGDYLNTSDLVIFPSKQEGLPLSVLEALYFNKMVISFNIRGCNDIISNGINGILVPKYNMKSMVEELIKYKNNSEKRIISNNIDKYKIEKVLPMIKNIYDKYSVFE